MKEFGKTILTIGEEYNLMFSIGGSIPTITYNQQVPLNSSVIYDGQLIGNVLSHSDFSLPKMKNFSSACCTNCVGSAQIINYERSKIEITFKENHKNITLFPYDTVNNLVNGWNCYNSVNIGGKVYKLLDIKFI